ncbi:hypothetical protein Tco_0684793 [Tanacetum coccineum]
MVVGRMTSLCNNPVNREPLPEDILGDTTQRDTSMWVSLPKDNSVTGCIFLKMILGATAQKDTGKCLMGNGVIMEYLINISKKRAFWSLNEDILKITILKTNTPYPLRKIRAASGLHPYHFTHPERKLTMEEMLYKFIDEGKREYEEMRAFILINNTPMIDCEVKGVTTRGGKTTTQDARNNDTNVHTEEPLAVNHDELVESNEVLTHDQPQKTNEPNAQPSDKIQTPPYPFLEDGGSKKKRLSRISSWKTCSSST